jgi:heat shock protein HslJ
MGWVSDRRRRPAAWWVALSLSCASCGGDGGEAGAGAAAEVAPAQETADLPAPSYEELAGATYSGVLDAPVTLVDGEWQGQPFTADAASRARVTLAPHFRITGDLDGEVGDEAVALLAENSGGSGTYEYLAVVGRREGGPVNLGTAPLGDRVQIRSARVRDGRIELDVVQAGPADAACCPSQKATRVWTLGPQGLREGKARITGTLSLADLRGVEWVLTHLGRNEPAPERPEVTLVFTEEGVSGSSGCNRYVGAARAGEQSGDLALGPLAGTRMACPPFEMQLEDRVLGALGAVVEFGFLETRLALTYEKGDGSLGTLIFASRPAGGAAEPPAPSR